MGTTNQLEDAITAVAGPLATTLGIGLFPTDAIPECAPGTYSVFGEFREYGVKDVRTATQLQDEYGYQFQFWGASRRAVNDVLDAFADNLDRSFHDLHGIPVAGGDIWLMLDRGCPKIPAMKSDKKDRYSKYVGIVQFRIKIGKTCS